MTDIDRQVAEQVMGWKKGMYTYYMNPDASAWLDSEGNLAKFTWKFNPSEKIEDAWLVVERMRELGYWWESHYSDNGWFWMFYNENINEESLSETAPPAICKAALQAVSEDIPSEHGYCDTVFGCSGCVETEGGRYVKYSELKEAETQRNRLWMLLDDIDTAEDMFKPDINNHFKYVNKKHKIRHDICSITDDEAEKATKANGQEKEDE